MNLNDIAYLRLINQQITSPEFDKIKDVVAWMGAMQAQDYNMAKLAIGMRLPETDNDAVESAIAAAEIIRTHILRPTWHFVAAEDIYWMLELSAPQIRSATKSRDAGLGITENISQKSNSLLIKLLSGGKQMLREELLMEYKNANLATDENRFYHYLMRAEIDGLIFSRNSGANKQTYSLLHEYVPHKQAYTRDEALSLLARKYFSSHGPATVYDFSWWSGLSVTESKKALEMNRPDLISEVIDNQNYWFISSRTIPVKKKKNICFLPAFDEFIISYKDRTATIPLQFQANAFTSNGIFNPVIVVNGEVVGTWKQKLKKDKLVITTNFFRQKKDLDECDLQQAAVSVGKFLHKDIEVIF